MRQHNLFGRSISFVKYPSSNIFCLMNIWLFSLQSGVRCTHGASRGNSQKDLGEEILFRNHPIGPLFVAEYSSVENRRCAIFHRCGEYIGLVNLPTLSKIKACLEQATGAFKLLSYSHCVGRNTRFTGKFTVNACPAKQYFETQCTPCLIAHDFHEAG